MFLRTTTALAALGWALAGACPAAAGDRLSGPIQGVVERVIDGDTIAVRVTVWLDQDIRVAVRLRGIDAPETRGDCEAEKARAGLATAAMKRIVRDQPVLLTAIEGDKYFGRVVADVSTFEGRDIATLLVAGGFARAYAGGAREPWCPAAIVGAAEAEAAIP